MPLTVSDHPMLRRRRTAVLVATALTPALLVWLLGHRGVHMARSLLLPGAGLYDERLWLGVGLTALAIGATVAWVRWGLDWAMAVTVLAAVLVSGFAVDPAVHDAATATGSPAAVTVSRAAHEFPLVLIVVGAITWVRAATRRVPLIGTLLRRRAARRRGIDDVIRLAPSDRARVAVIAALADDAALLDAVSGWDRPDVERRCRTIDRWARARSVRRARARPADHAPVRAARSAADPGGGEFRALLAAAERSPWGAPCSEPGWLRPLDATLAVLVISRNTGGDGTDGAERGDHATPIDRWRHSLTSDFALRRGHRPAACWTPLGVAAGAMPPWEHATVTALAHHAGWLDARRDWDALRRATLGAAARHDRDAHDERLVAAGRWLARTTGDHDALRILQRAHLRHDPLAVALDRLATAATSLTTAADGTVHPPEGHLIR